ncbi:hypothetical protein ND910_01750 [Schaalia meyeri]|uniref:hypothetical protein n=1 Tax=Schaalia meyeri TaxID=52773 RepID=UPI00204453C7|nr:hypothetical protein [Schaalia meyeri]MCM3898442.1 hypothetical protein [Schaalia meyeri]
MTYVLALAMVVLIAGAQWFFTSRALRSPSHFIAWVSGGYAAKIALLALGLYVPRALGVNVRLAAIATIAAIIVSSSVEMVLMMRRRTMNVDPRPEGE